MLGIALLFLVFGFIMASKVIAIFLLAFACVIGGFVFVHKNIKDVYDSDKNLVKSNSALRLFWDSMILIVPGAIRWVETDTNGYYGVNGTHYYGASVGAGLLLGVGIILLVIAIAVWIVQKLKK